MKKSERYGFPLCIQLIPPENFYEDREFLSVLETLRDKGFYGVEWNLTDFEHSTPVQLGKFLAGFDLKLTMIASGFLAKKEHLSLSAADEKQRRRSVEALGEMADFAKALGAGVICGFIKGGAGEERESAGRQMEKSLGELGRYGEGGVDIYLEATNHYEASLVNRVCEGAEMIQHAEGPFKILPDTYHMNIEEASMEGALIQFREYYGNLHLSDNNRYFPGFGALDFYHILKILKQMDYQGTITIEGRNQFSLKEDILYTTDYLENVGKRLRIT